MIFLGKTQELVVNKSTDFGIYLIADESKNPIELSEEEERAVLDNDSVLLPKAQIPESCKKGDVIRVFIYKDSEDRPIATTIVPALELGGLALLTVKSITPIGAFLSWNLPKDLLLPFREQTRELKAGDTITVSLYIDKSQRLCATMRVYPYLKTNSSYQKGDWVDGTVYEILPNFGAFVAVDDIYSALIPNKELIKPIYVGEKVHARIAIRQEDGKLELSMQNIIPEQMNLDGADILRKLEEAGGFLPYHDKTDPNEIKDKFHLSKNAFKRAIGHLMKEGMITITDSGIQKVNG